MKQETNAYDRGRTGFSKGNLRKPTNDTQFMLTIASSTRIAKEAEIKEWKRGWDEAKNETETPAKPVKKKAKKKAKRKTKGKK